MRESLVENVAPKTKRLGLPFAVPARDREKPFTKRMEAAAILCLSELERVKSSGFVLRRKKPEKLLFISEICYPIWLAPWRGRSLLFDAIGVTTHELLHSVLPDPKAFIANAQGSSVAREAYSAFLSNNLNYFQGFIDTEEKTIEGLMADSDFVHDLFSYLPEAKPFVKPVTGKALLSTTIDEAMLSPLLQDFMDFRTTLGEEIEDLMKTMKNLSSITQAHLKANSRENREIRREYSVRITQLRPSVMLKLRQTRERRDRKVTRTMKTFERRLQRLYRERVKLERTMQNTIAKAERCIAEARTSKSSGDSIRELRWREDAKACRKKESTLERMIKETDKKIQGVSAAKKQKMFEIKSEFDVLSEEAMQPLRSLEASRDAEIRMKAQEREMLQDSSSTIISQIDELVHLKKTALENFDGMGVPQRRRKHVLAYIPAYLVCFERETKRRYAIFPPSIVSGLGITTKVRGVLRGTKIKSLLQPRSRAITDFLNHLLTLLEQNPVFEKELYDAGIQVNIFRTKASREDIRRGLEELNVEGWISEEEAQRCRNLLIKG